MNVVIVESPAKAKTINEYLGSDYRGAGLVRACARPAGQGRLGRSRAGLRHDLGGRRQGAKRLSDIARAVKGADKRHPRDRPGSRGRGDLLARAGGAARPKAAQGQDGRARHLQRHHQGGGARRRCASARDRPGAGRRLSGAPRARLSRGLQPVAGAVAQAAGRPLGRPRAVGGAAARLRPRDARSRSSGRANTGRSSRTLRTARRRDLRGAARRRRRQEDHPPRHRHRRARPQAFKAALETRAASRWPSVEAKPAKRHPLPPFRTSTLQQEASRKLGLSPARTMQIAQQLYEGVDIGGETVGLITYMRTDGVDMAPEAIAGRAPRDRRAVTATRYVPEAPRKYTRQGQERPGGARGDPADRPVPPAQDVARYLDAEQAKLYELIWKRTVASQMESAELERTTVDIAAEVGDRAARAARHRPGGAVRRLPDALPGGQGRRGGRGEPAACPPWRPASRSTSERDRRSTQHFTEPPPRYSEESLVKRMEELGIGRPSTYAATLAGAADREYVRLDKKRLMPEDKGRLVTAFLESFFARWVDYDFTADLEEQLDRVSNDEIDWRRCCATSGAISRPPSARPRTCAPPRCSTTSTRLLGPHIFPAKGDGIDPRTCPPAATASCR